MRCEIALFTPWTAKKSPPVLKAGRLRKERRELFEGRQSNGPTADGAE
ncbi:MAG: hypothetical protein ACTSYB_02520 [Candidatus Helarchaeota archaeon]